MNDIIVLRRDAKIMLVVCFDQQMAASNKEKKE